VRTQRYRLDCENRLFDMQSDPGQDHNVAREVPDVAARLSAAVGRWRAEVLPGLEHLDRPFTVGYPDFPITQLPARDGIAHGGIRRSSPAPNCSYFTHWTSVDDSITWDVAVETPGRYEAVVYYTCPKADVGSAVELEFRQSRVRGVVSEAHDPPLCGAEHDRFPRQGESFVKDFNPLRLGLIELPAARGLLTLRATAVPGAEVMEVRSILLTLQEPARGPRQR
jgi:hypothetical protein